MSIKIHIQDIPTEKTHNGTTFRKRLITTEEQKGRIATSNYAWLTSRNALEPHAHADGEEWFGVAKGDFVTVPKGVMHSLKNFKDEDLIFLTIRTVD
ncbi:MAG: hypothetical protein AAB508_06325 [Patescibacteria group bacterium]